MPPGSYSTGVGKEVRHMNDVREFFAEEDAVGVVEIILILVDIPTKKERQRYSV